jgi:3-phenylpropionate/cinnamic acid dioxygenase small subunit
MTVLSAERQILNLLHRYCDCVDRGDFDGVSALFGRGRYYMDDSLVLTGDEIGAAQRRIVQTYTGGRPATKHVVSNTILEIDGAAARAQSYFVVFQAVPGMALQPILTGRYIDEFFEEDGVWWFADRRSAIDHAGELSNHVVPAVADALRAATGT